MDGINTHFAASDAAHLAFQLQNNDLSLHSSAVALEALKDYGPATEDAAYACVCFAAQASLGMATETTTTPTEADHGNTSNLSDLRPVLSGRRPVQPSGGHARVNPQPRYPHHGYGAARHPQPVRRVRIRKLPVLDRCKPLRPLPPASA